MRSTAHDMCFGSIPDRSVSPNAERKNIYARECDIRITNNSTPERAVQKIMQDRIGK